MCPASWLFVGEEQTAGFGSGCWVPGILPCRAVPCWQLTLKMGAESLSCLHPTPLAGILRWRRLVGTSALSPLWPSPQLWASPAVDSGGVPSIAPRLACLDVCRNQLLAWRAGGVRWRRAMEACDEGVRCPAWLSAGGDVSKTKGLLPTSQEGASR